jgi:hypothetical protein
MFTRSKAFVAKLFASLLGSNTPAAVVSHFDGVHTPIPAREVVL